MKRGFCLFLVAVLLAGLVPCAFADEAKTSEEVEASEAATEAVEETTAPPETAVPSESTEPPEATETTESETEVTEPEPDFSDLRKVDIAYTTITDEEVPVQVSVDLVDFRLDRSIDGTIVDSRKYDTLKELTEQELVDPDFDELVAFSEREMALVLPTNWRQNSP